MVGLSVFYANDMPGYDGSPEPYIWHYNEMGHVLNNNIMSTHCICIIKYNEIFMTLRWANNFQILYTHTDFINNDHYCAYTTLTYKPSHQVTFTSNFPLLIPTIATNRPPLSKKSPQMEANINIYCSHLVLTLSFQCQSVTTWITLKYYHSINS